MFSLLPPSILNCFGVKGQKQPLGISRRQRDGDGSILPCDIFRGAVRTLLEIISSVQDQYVREPRVSNQFKIPTFRHGTHNTFGPKLRIVARFLREVPAENEDRKSVV